jgi:gliding motility-associated-like protein
MLDLGTTITLNFGQVVTLDPSIIGENGSVTFDWTPKDSTVLSCFTCRNPTVTVDNQTNIGLVVTDENGCTAEDFITVAVRRNRSVLVPTGFTPNGDGMNERLLVHGVAGTKVLLFRVYDRWGELIHESGDFEVNDPTNGWDGNFRNKMMSSGVYIWYLEVEYIDGVEEAFQGSTTLIR